ncbi:hypothetical protein HNR06_004288 [Nocardiopsis arvandica]|uniref:Class F sortase n=1 Tax=Nocardiopsis sinuspersici TaxID=501010 RepID=A0A7Y9XF37_9ACTN|nr:class F sortase [Nocardiopsis sinuspersici]NYH54699.1 hypothetical protein [Nocardiopsis sinuspersici]
MSAERPRAGDGRRRTSAAAIAVAATTGALLIAFALTTGQDEAPAPPGHSAQSQRSTGDGPEVARTSPPSPRAHARSLPHSAPVGLEIEAIGVDVDDVVRLGLEPDGEIEAPQDYDAVGWYEHGPSPGQSGPAVIGGHVDSRTAPAVFYRLGELQPGDTVRVERADETTVGFTVYAVEQHPKDDFPTERVYGPTGGGPELRLITCGGRFDEATRSYRSNTVVYAELAPQS